MFFVRDNVVPVAFGLKNAQIAALVILVVAVLGLILITLRDRRNLLIPM